ncbi:MAG: ExbD/TolR family protein [Nannocystales bacterium]
MLFRVVLATSLLGAASCSRPVEGPPPTQQAAANKLRTTAPAEPSSVSPRRPAAESPRIGPQATLMTLSVTVTPAKLFVRGKSVEPAQLRPQLQALAKRYPDATVAVQADATVPEKRLAKALEAIKAAGFETVEVATRPVR